MEVYIGLVFPSAFNYAPVDTALCQGQLVNINQNQALYAIVGTLYGGNGTSTFGLPDLQGRVPIGAGVYRGNSVINYTLGQKNINAETTTLGINNLPAHNHSAQTVLASTPMGLNITTVTATASGSLPVNQTGGTTNVPGTTGTTVGFPAVIPDLSGAGISDNNFYAPQDANKSTMPVDVSVNITKAAGTVTGGITGATTTIGNTGSGASFTNLPPFLCLNYLIILQGYFPPRQ